MQDKRSVEKFFQSQNISIRKAIRQIDLAYDYYGVSTNNNANQSTKRGDVNILIVGPPGSGKSTLLRTMHYALNGSLSCYIQNRNINETYYDRYQIKRNKRNVVEGLSKLKQTDEKLGVYGYQINFHAMSQQYKNSMDRYSRTVQLMCNRSFGCIGHNISNSSFSGINFVIICLNMIQKLKKQEFIALRFFINQLDEKKIKFIIVGTHLDKILGRQSLNSSFGSNKQQQKLVYIQDWKKFIQAQICPKIFVQVYSMQNYSNICKKQEFQNSEAINFYSLTLLDKCIQKAPQSQKSKKFSLKLFCF